MTERFCAKCGQDIPNDDHPWTFSGGVGEDTETGPDEPVLVCEDCYDDRNPDPS